MAKTKFKLHLPTKARKAPAAKGDIMLPTFALLPSNKIYVDEEVGLLYYKVNAYAQDDLSYEAFEWSNTWLDLLIVHSSSLMAGYILKFPKDVIVRHFNSYVAIVSEDAKDVTEYKNSECMLNTKHLSIRICADKAALVIPSHRKEPLFNASFATTFEGEDLSHGEDS